LPQQTEDRGSVSGGDDRAEQHPFQQRQSKEPGCGKTADSRRQQGARYCQSNGDTQHWPELPEPDAQPALEQDQCQGHHPDRAGKLIVGEVDPAHPVGANRHPESDEQHETGDPQPPGRHCRQQAGKQERR
jgi:hypothetical protein